MCAFVFDWLYVLCYLGSRLSECNNFILPLDFSNYRPDTLCKRFVATPQNGVLALLRLCLRLSVCFLRFVFLVSFSVLSANNFWCCLANNDRNIMFSIFISSKITGIAASHTWNLLQDLRT